ncbi:DotI/IcmL family type IV secretion protein [Legionella parisiensis]|uniref:DotI/IcmL family type IV secretion protein n=1 Tax=Legionella parisiensis TaxID=45071 RepID=UPI00073081E7|nr:DotI/IcmL family type IV secretion protein [Legionella parisiensis]KTD42236.1 IcmL-like protein [Legionella parisiensis]STX72303.1 IcmL-like protein [Legionella parisiensis]
MKKNIVCGALFNLICILAYAGQTTDAISEKISTHVKSNKGVMQAETTYQKSNTTTKNQSIEINCDYRISPDTQKVDNALIVSWAEYAVLHSFKFDLLSFDAQLNNLKKCYTKNGWTSYINALTDSGNINSIKTQKLMVSSMLDGKVQLIDAQETQWKMNVPIKVFYKNDKEEITHFLNVYLIISWRNAFKLGIVQIVATPRRAALSQKAAAIKEALGAVSLSVTHQISSAENLKKMATSFLTSLFIATGRSLSETDRILSHPELCLKLEYDITSQLQHLAEEQKALGYEKAIKTLMAKLTSYFKNEIQNPLMANSFEWTRNKFLAIKSDFYAIKLPKLFSYFKDKETVNFYAALPKFDKIKVLDTLNTLNEQQNNKIQFVQNIELSKPSQIPKITFNRSSEERPETINCNYKIPGEMKTINEGLVIKWAEYAATQSFDFNPVSIESQLQQLESCYTAKGWANFKNALDKSGNIEAIRSQNFSMNSRVNGQIKLLRTGSNQWNIELPLQVVYQNKQVNVTQFLNVNLTMGRKPTGEFGIMRIIANLKEPVNPDTVTPSQSPVTPSVLQNTQQSTVEQPKKAALIDCDYKTPVEIKNVSQAIILAWAEHAATQSFNFDSKSIDEQLQKLQSCYTKQGWDEFINAIEKSGNIQAFKTQKLSATSQIDGVPQLIESRDNKWTLTLPLKINYQFQNSSAIQLLKVDLTIGRKSTGELGIIRLNSTLRVASNEQP